MRNTPQVSVLMPTYNYAGYLGEAIQSVLDQTFQDFELIIVDDQSKDNTDEVVKKYLSDPRVTYYKNEKNLGLVGNFNKCLEYANGKYIKYLLADDKFAPVLLERFVAVMEEHPSVSLVTSARQMFGDVNTVIAPLSSGLHSGEEIIKECLNGGKGNVIGEPTTVMFRKSDLHIGKFDSRFICLVDLDLWLRFLTVGDCYIVPETLSYFRVHGSQASSKANIRNWLDEYYFYKAVKTQNRYKIDLSELDIDKTVQRKAKKCVKRILSYVPKFYKKGNFGILQEGFRIARTENIF